MISKLLATRQKLARDPLFEKLRAKHLYTPDLQYSCFSFFFTKYLLIIKLDITINGRKQLIY